MTEVPEHLLRRSRERRAALGLAGGEAPPAGEAAAAPPAEEAPAAAEPSAPAAAAAEEPASQPTIEPTIDVPPYVAPPAPPRRVPIWVMPVLIFLPLWAVVYFGTFGERGAAGPVDPLVLGEEIYSSQGCAGCHGATGGGGVGPELAGGESKLTFPNEADHINWVRTGSGPFTGQKYGDPSRAGGQHGPATGGMPAFGNLSDEEIQAVVTYEREEL